MSAGVTRLSDLIVPQIFTPYTQILTQQKSRLIRSGAIVVDAELSGLMNGAGLTFNQPFFKDLDDDAENISTDDPATLSSPNKIGTGLEIQVRLSRNNSWSSMDLNKALIGKDPLDAISNLVSDYWIRRAQLAFMATVKGVFAQNDLASPVNSTQYDMTFNASGASYVAGVTNFTAESFIDATLTMGDSMQSLGMIFVHSVVFARMQKNNLIDFIPDSRGEVMIPTFLGREVIVDDAMPNAAGVFESWLFGAGAFQMGMGSPKVPTEVYRAPAAGNGSGQDVLHNRVEWCIHPVGYAYSGTPANGGPSNAATTSNLAHSASFVRVFNERKQIKIARLKTREY